MKQNKARFFAVVCVGVMSLGASRCQNQEPPEPVAPVIDGSWKWSCAASSAPEVSVQTNITPLAGPKCHEQVSQDSPFIGYVSEHIMLNEDQKSWKASFELGVCVDEQAGTFEYIYSPDDKVWQLSIFDSDQQLQKTYSVQKVSDNELELNDETQRCVLKKDEYPKVLAGAHPRPNPPVQISWDLRFDGSPIVWTSVAQWPLIYQLPLQQTQVPNPSPYRVEYAVLHVSGDGSQIENYAVVIYVYRRSTGERLSYSEPVDLQPNIPIVQEFFDTVEGAAVQLKAVMIR